MTGGLFRDAGAPVIARLRAREESEVHMSGSWWIVWMVFMFLFLLPPVGYGWGYRGWGPPYPRYLQRHRSQQAAASGLSGPFRHESWGWGGDFVWTMLIIGAVWFMIAMLFPLWRR
jgi:hypothetical protein